MTTGHPRQRSPRFAASVAVLLAVLLGAGLPVTARATTAPSPSESSPPVAAGDAPYFETAVVEVPAPDATASDPSAGVASRHVDLPIDGQLVNIRWQGDPEVGLELRSRDDVGWSGWVDAHRDADEAPDDGPETDGRDRYVLGPVWTGDGTDALEIRVESGAPRGLEVEVLRSVEPEGWVEPSASTSATPSAATPPIIRRNDWGAGPWRSDHGGCAGGPFSAGEIRFGIVHHTVSTNDYAPSQSDDIVRAIYHAHTVGNGWCDIGYNFLVDKYGQRFEGRSQSLYQPITGGHAKGFNSGSVGVALLGQYHPGASPPAATVSTAQRLAVADILAWKLDQYFVNPYGTTVEVSGGSTSIPAGVVVTLPTIIGHRDVGATGCPGTNMYVLLNQLKADVNARSAGVYWTFNDVKPNHPFYDEIEWMHASQLTNGYPDGSFKPLSWVTRQATMVFLYRFAASPGGPFPNPGYTDVAASHPFFTAIAWASDRDITTGYPDGSFRPTLWVARQAVAAFMYRLANSPPGPFPDPGFSDVPPSHPFYTEIAWAKHNGVIKGFSDGTFRGDKPVTRQASASFMYNLAELF